METELINVLKHDFYNEKLLLYSDITVETVNYLMQFKAFNLISQEEFDKNWEFFGKFYINLIELNQKIIYKYSNMMDEIFDTALDGDGRHVRENYVERAKLDDFNGKMDEFIEYADTYIDGLLQILDDLALAKMFCTDITLLGYIEQDFNATHQKIEKIEELYGNFEDSLEGYE